MKTNEAKAKVTQLLNKNGFTIDDNVISWNDNITAEKSLKMRNEMSGIVFTNADGNDCVYQIRFNKNIHKLVEVEI